MTTETHELIGGWVRIRHGGGQVFLVDAGPNPGFTIDVDHDGPDEVKVVFESSDHKSTFRAEYEDGVLDIRKLEESEDED
jgi:hypothetical protein